MIPLTDAIYAKFVSASLINTITGGYWPGRAPAGTAFPYLVMSVIDGPLTDAYGNVTSYDAVIQIKVVGNGYVATGQAMKAVTDVYDNTILTLATGKNIGMYRQNQPRPMELPEQDIPYKDNNIKDVWQWIAEYVYSVQ